SIASVKSRYCVRRLTPLQVVRYGDVLLMLLWIVAAAALLVAGAALVKARRLARRLERLTESYWELRYEHGQLRARVNRLDPEPTSGPEEPAARADTTVVPLSSLKR